MNEITNYCKILHDLILRGGLLEDLIAVEQRSGQMMSVYVARRRDEESHSTHQLLVNDAGCGYVGSRAAILLGHSDAQQTHIAELPEERLIEPGGHVDQRW